MGKDNIRRNGNHEEVLTSQPFKKTLKEFKPWGPPCLKCGENVDTRLGASAPNNLKGARRSQRQGYVHDRCLETTEVNGVVDKVVHSEARSSLNLGSVEIERGTFMDMVVGRGIAMEFPVYTEDEMLAAIEAGEALPS